MLTASRETLGSELAITSRAPREPGRANIRPDLATVARRVSYTWIASALVAALIPVSNALAFAFEDVVARAQQLAAGPYQPPVETPRFMREMGYDQYRGIRHQAQHNLWRDAHSGFQVSPVMPGSVYARIVPINEVNGSNVRRLAFRKKHFTFDEPELGQRIPDDLGYAGFELSYSLNRPAIEGKFLVFAGASYFRAIGKGGQWGLSVRGAAIDTGLASGEEFPDFIEFWLVRPRARAKRMTVYALLNSPRLTGAYKFLISPGASTRLGVRAVLFTRHRIEQLGIAPLTSMYNYGENTPRPRDAWRPEVHDSDGLLVHDASGDWIWQPLLNPSKITIHSFSAGNEFGLLQRDTRFASYEDAETNYHRRPSAVVGLQQGFETGRILLVQLPTKNEFMDNIVAFWSLPGAVDGGTKLDLKYRLSLGGPTIAQTKLGQVVNTFVGRDVIDATSMAGQYRFVVDFRGARLDQLKADAPLVAAISAHEGTAILEHQLKRVDATGFWRLSILARAGADNPLALRASLNMNGRQVTEVWSYELEANNAVRRDE
jgi:periplasmic glucans biosynthesis protein